MEKVEMITGQRYRIEFEDCCVEGSVTGVFERWRLDDDMEPTTENGDYSKAVFDIGIIGPRYGAWEVTKIEC